nr:integrase, catalytic region, zinc finger, CCHC-type, peptidase aspartic, catalytic [Tanacetum cinerariifolium]
MPAIKPKVLTPSMYAIDVEPISPHNRNNREVHLDYLKHFKKSVETLHEIVEEARIEKPFALENACFYTKRSQELLEYVIGTCTKEFSKRDKKVVQILLWYLDSGYSKHMTGNRSLLKNFIKKFTGKVRFRNDHFGAIMGYGDYVIGDIVISWLNHLNFGTINDLVRKYQVRGLPRYIRTDNGTEFVNQVMTKFYEGVGITHQKYFLRAPQQNDSVERRIHTLVEATQTIEDLGKLKATADIGIFVGYAPNRKGYKIYNKRTRRIMEAIHVQFDELTKHMAHVHISSRPEPNLLMPEQIIQVLVVSNGAPSFTRIDQDATSISHSPLSSEVQDPISHQGVAAGPTIEDNPFA